MWFLWGGEKGGKTPRRIGYGRALTVTLMVYARSVIKATLGWMIPIGLLAAYGWNIWWQKWEGGGRSWWR